MWALHLVLWFKPEITPQWSAGVFCLVHPVFLNIWVCWQHFKIGRFHIRSRILSFSWKVGRFGNRTPIFLGEGEWLPQVFNGPLMFLWPLTELCGKEGSQYFLSILLCDRDCVREICLHIAFNPHCKLLEPLFCQQGNRGSESWD